MYIPDHDESDRMGSTQHGTNSAQSRLSSLFNAIILTKFHPDVTIQ